MKYDHWRVKSYQVTFFTRQEEAPVSLQQGTIMCSIFLKKRKKNEKFIHSQAAVNFLIEMSYEVQQQNNF